MMRTNDSSICLVDLIWIVENFTLPSKTAGHFKSSADKYHKFIEFVSSFTLILWFQFSFDIDSTLQSADRFHWCLITFFQTKKRNVSFDIVGLMRQISFQCRHRTLNSRRKIIWEHFIKIYLKWKLSVAKRNGCNRMEKWEITRWGGTRFCAINIQHYSGFSFVYIINAFHFKVLLS